MGWLSAVGGFLALVLPLVVGVRFTRAARLRRAIKEDVEILDTLKDEKARDTVNDVIRHEANELLHSVRVSRGAHPFLLLAPLYIGGSIALVVFQIGDTSFEDAGPLDWVNFAVAIALFLCGVAMAFGPLERWISSHDRDDDSESGDVGE